MLTSVRQFPAFAATLLCLLFSSQVLALGSLPDFTGLAKDYGPAVVNISTQKTVKSRRQVPHFNMPDLPENSPFNDLFRHFFQMPQGPKGKGRGIRPEKRSLGSGFIISKDGYIVTNHHVIDGADEVIVRLNDRREYIAQVIGSDERSDIALLKI